MGLRISAHVRPGEEVGPRACVGAPLPSGGTSGLEPCEAGVEAPPGSWRLPGWREGVSLSAPGLRLGGQRGRKGHGAVTGVQPETVAFCAE